MPKEPGAKLYKDAARWPVMPPWWLLSSPQSAALINVTPATLHYWRTRGEGPETVPSLFLRKTQGDPVFYIYGVLRTWAAERVGIQYDFDDQCSDYFLHAQPHLNTCFSSLAAKAGMFDHLHEHAREKVGRGEDPGIVDRETVLSLDAFYAKQPKWRRQEAKYEWDGRSSGCTETDVRGDPKSGLQLVFARHWRIRCLDPSNTVTLNVS